MLVVFMGSHPYRQEFHFTIKRHKKDLTGLIMTQTSISPNPSMPEVIEVPYNSDQVKCDGGGGALGHPVVFYAFDGRDRVECLYCDRVFQKAKS
jgi:uncharacterized Zn-finger protein